MSEIEMTSNCDGQMNKKNQSADYHYIKGGGRLQLENSEKVYYQLNGFSSINGSRHDRNHAISGHGRKHNFKTSLQRAKSESIIDAGPNYTLHR